jgi:hypothetical protein
VELTTTQVSLFAALIALAAPAITYRASARLDRDRWVRERRAETYIDALAVLGRIATYVAEPDKRPDPFEAVPGDQWRQFQARVEAFASTTVLSLRDSLLTAWERYRSAMAAAAAGSAEDAAVHRKEARGSPGRGPDPVRRPHLGGPRGAQAGPRPLVAPDRDPQAGAGVGLTPGQFGCRPGGRVLCWRRHRPQHRPT